MVAGDIDHQDEKWYSRNHIELRLDTFVTQFNLDRRLAVLQNGQTIEFRKACLAMGSRPRKPPVAGTNLGNVVYLRTIRDSLAIREITGYEKNIVVIGGGFVGVEVAASLRELEHKIALMVREEFV